MLQIRGENLGDEGDGRTMYVVHPNCAVDEPIVGNPPVPLLSRPTSLETESMRTAEVIASVALTPPLELYPRPLAPAAELKRLLGTVKGELIARVAPFAGGVAGGVMFVVVPLNVASATFVAL